MQLSVPKLRMQSTLKAFANSKCDDNNLLDHHKKHAQYLALMLKLAGSHVSHNCASTGADNLLRLHNYPQVCRTSSMTPNCGRSGAALLLLKAAHSSLCECTAATPHSYTGEIKPQTLRAFASDADLCWWVDQARAYKPRNSFLG